MSENGDREATLHNVLTFIAEQQKYVHSIEGVSPGSTNDITKEFNIEGPPQQAEELKIGESDLKTNNDENYVTLKQLCEEYSLKEKEAANNKTNISKIVDFKQSNIDKIPDNIRQNITYAEEVCLVTPIDIESENCSNISEHPVDICSSVSVELTSMDYQNGVSAELVNGKEEKEEETVIGNDTVQICQREMIPNGG